ncbi:hypothetical protein E3N88_37196 [Mikania micrantha]|uniref:Reverse transcriptase zinc-binding domain-containing protein n=1 Tax=Mikania micrantha TaxID=192012 RepID=A0A5N6M6Z0_9ASTR|nr:hypothetical protein E3N88_37196 [Mikania micrantha]
MYLRNPCNIFILSESVCCDIGSSKSRLISETSPLCFRNHIRVYSDIISGDERWGCDTLCHKGVVVASTLCPSCGMAEETVDHMFAKCVVAKTIWWQICRWVKIPIPISFASVGKMLDFAKENGGEGNMKKVINLIFHATIWRIWLARNDKVFKGINTSWYKVVEEVKELSFLWISNRSRFNMAGWEMWKNFQFS